MMDERRESRPSAVGQALKVLIVDADLDERRVLQQAVMAIGHQCASLADGLEASRVLEKHPADVIIADSYLPSFSGLELCRRIRASQNDAYTYVILVTSRPDKRLFLEAMSAGADDAMAKPIDLEVLAARLLPAGRIIEVQRNLAAKNRELRHDSQRNFLAARIDPLTSIANRRQLAEDLEVLFGTPYRLHHSLAIADIDDFKRYNDRFEHQAGDQVLKEVAMAMRSAIRQGDWLYRYGGEEMLVILRDQRLDAAARTMERVRGAVEALGIEHPEGPAGVVTISVGVAELTPDVHSAEVWIHRADAALYRAKAGGKNRVELSPRAAPRS